MFNAASTKYRDNKSYEERFKVQDNLNPLSLKYDERGARRDVKIKNKL